MAVGEPFTITTLAPAPTASDIERHNKERILEDPALAVTPSEDEIAFVKELMDTHSAEQIAAKEPVEDFLLPRADTERFAMRPWNMPEVTDDGVGPLHLHDSWQEREMIILYQDDGR